MNLTVKHKQVGSQFNSYTQGQYQGAASCPINGRHNIPVAFANRKCVSPMTFYQKLYQKHELKIAEEFEQAVDDNSLEKVKLIFDKVLETRENRVIG